MDEHTFFGKKDLCYTEVIDFTDYQGIGKDPLYKRYDSVWSVISAAIAPEYRHFLAVPLYNDKEDRIYWYIDIWEDFPQRFSELEGAEKARYQAIKDATVSHYRTMAQSLSGEELQILGSALKYVDDERIYCADGKVFLVAWGMTPDTRKHKIIGTVIHHVEDTKSFKVVFNAEPHGELANKMDKFITKPNGYVIKPEDLPNVSVKDGWKFDGWTPEPIGLKIEADTTFTARYSENIIVVPPMPPLPPPEPQLCNIFFNAGSQGTALGRCDFQVPANSSVEAGMIPQVKPNKGYKFVGWDINPLNMIATGDMTFNAIYEKKQPWYKKSFWKWLLLGLLLLLLLLLMLFGLDKCGCTSCIGPHLVNGIIPVDSIAEEELYEPIQPITGEDGELPEDNGKVAPFVDGDGNEVPIIKQPGAPDVIGNRLILFIEDESGSVDALAKDFKTAYPGEQYSIIGFDREVKMLVIQIPADERDHIRKTINSKIPGQKFFVFDEEIYERESSEENYEPNMSLAGWHLKAIRLQEGWQITKGDPNVKVAVVDDGIDAYHQMFTGRIVDAYNVFTKDNRLTKGSGHGTHCAGLAVGSADLYSKGAAGVAPNCKLMPVQVFAGEHTSLSAWVAGIMYAIHHDADVINCSIAPSFKGLNMLPPSQQVVISKNQFLNAVRLWKRVCSIAMKKNSVIVFAAGNDDIYSSIPAENRNAMAITVTAVDNRRYPTIFTNYGPCSDISAPGIDILSSFPVNDLNMLQGTSMAAPIVSGTIALMKSIKKDLTVEQAANALYYSGAQVYGYIPPMVQVDAALQATRAGKFDKPAERGYTPVPEGDWPHNNGVINDRIPIINDDPEGEIEDGRIDGYVDDERVGNGTGDDNGNAVPVNPRVDGDGNRRDPNVKNPDTTPDSGEDYEAIRRLIRDYKRKISELEKQLPENKK